MHKKSYETEIFDLSLAQSQALMTLGTNWLAQGKYDLAEVLFKGILAIDESQKMAALLLGQTLLSAGLVNEAYTHLAELINRFHDCPLCRFTLAKAAILLDNRAEATSLLDEVVAMTESKDDELSKKAEGILKLLA